MPAGMEAAEDEMDVEDEEIPELAERTVDPSVDLSSAAPTLTPPYLLVRVLEDMDMFMGVDGRIYTLAKGDIVTLPERNASVLSDRNIVIAITLPSCK
jgi:DNA replication factor GINS